jgi:glucose/mannose transport system substrate-binding protein
MDRSLSKRLIASLGVLTLLVMACGATPATQAPATGTSAGATATPVPATPAVTASPAAVACPATSTPIEVASWWTTGGEATGLDKLFAKFNADNPGLCAYNAAIAGGAGTRAKAIFKARVIGGAPPDTLQVHMGHDLLDTYVNLPGGSLLDPLDTSIIDPTKFPPGVVSIISGADGKPYTVPVNIHRANEMWFNKSVFESNSLTAPTTWAEFFTAADTLKAKNITPLALGDGDGIWPFGMVFETILIAELGIDGFSKLWTDPTSWNDPKVAQALTDLQKVYGYVNTDHNALTWDKANQLVIDGKAAMTIMGDWANGDYVAKKFTGYGWAPAPGNADIYQALADSFPLPTMAPDKDATKKLLTFMASAEGQDIFNPYKGSIPARTDAGHPPADALQYNEYQISALADWKVNTVVPSMEHGAAASPAFVSAIEAALTAFETSGDVTATQAALAAAAQEALAPAQ